jgi:hypothetical protein
MNAPVSRPPSLPSPLSRTVNHDASEDEIRARAGIRQMEAARSSYEYSQRKEEGREKGREGQGWAGGADGGGIGELREK